MEELFTALFQQNFNKRIIPHPLELKHLSKFFFSFPIKHDLKKSSWLVGQSVGVSVGHLTRYNVK